MEAVQNNGLDKVQVAMLLLYLHSMRVKVWTPVSVLTDMESYLPSLYNRICGFVVRASQFEASA